MTCFAVYISISKELMKVSVKDTMITFWYIMKVIQISKMPLFVKNS